MYFQVSIEYLKIDAIAVSNLKSKYFLKFIDNLEFVTKSIHLDINHHYKYFFKMFEKHFIILNNH